MPEGESFPACFSNDSVGKGSNMASFTYKCPNCGAPLQWDPGKAHIDCDYCGGEFTAREVEEYNEKQIGEREARDRSDAESRHTAAAESASAPAESAGQPAPVRSYHCDSCGAEVVTDSHTAATFCYYCHNPVILTDRLRGDFRPDQIIPFRVDRKQAEQHFLAWAKSKRFVPKSFYSHSQLEKLTGIYLPFWVAKASTRLNLQGRGTQTRTWNTATERKTETNVYRISRQGELEYENMTEMAYRKDDKIDPEQVETIADYRLDERQPFAMPYLSGFFAETPTVSEEEAAGQMHDRASRYAEQSIQEQLSSFDSTELEVREADTAVDELQYVLMPAWIMTYKFLGRTYVYAINGQSGKSFGELPVDKGKLGLWSILLCLAVLILLLLGGQFLWRF